MKAIPRSEFHCADCGALMSNYATKPLEDYQKGAYKLRHPSGACPNADKLYALPTVELEEVV